MQTGELRQLLRKRFPVGQYALLWEVGTATGFDCAGWADAVVMGLWPSRGLTFTGCELKVSRSDWKKELDNPEKSEKFIRYCDSWYLVAGDASIVKPGELPDKWGMLVAKGGKLHCEKEAPKLSPEPIDRKFLAAIIRRVDEQNCSKSQLQAARAEAYKTIQADFEGRQNRDAKFAEQKLKTEQERNARLVARIQKFEEITGVSIGHHDYWRNDVVEIGEAVKILISRRGIPGVEDLAKVKESADKLSALAAELIRAFEPAPPKTDK